MRGVTCAVGHALCDMRCAVQHAWYGMRVAARAVMHAQRTTVSLAALRAPLCAVYVVTCSSSPSFTYTAQRSGRRKRSPERGRAVQVVRS